MHRARSLLLLIVLAFVAALHAEKPALITRTFKLPPDFLSCDLPTESAAPAAPADPFRDAASLDRPPMGGAPPPPRPNTTKQTLEAAGITFPEGASASFNPLTGLLTITNTSANLDLAEAYVESVKQQAPANVAFTLTVIEGPGDLIRAANVSASRVADAAPALAMFLDHAKKTGSNVRVIGDAFLETKSGTRATVEAVREHSYVTEFNLDAKSRASIAKEMHQAGIRLEIEPIVGADSRTIETSLSLTLNAAPATQRQVSINDPLTGHVAEFPATDIPGTHIVTEISIMAGNTKLIGVTKPVGAPQESADILCAAFLTATLRRVEALPDPQPKVAAPSSLPPGMIFAALHAPAGLFDEVLHGTKPVTLQAWLAQAGITFPSGSMIEHRDGVLRLINTQDNITLITVILDQLLSVSPKTVAFTRHTLEAPAPFLRDLTRQTIASADDSAMFTAVEAAVARGEARFIDSTFLETKSGTRALLQAAREHFYLDNFGTDAKGHPELSFEMRPVGSILELEPTVGADSRTIELTFCHELHPTSPIQRQDQFRDPSSQKSFEMPVTDFNLHKTTTSISVTRGGTKLISLNEPTGRNKPGMLWATFLKCDVVPQVSLPRNTIEEPRKVVKPQLSEDSTETYVRSYRVPPDFLSGPPEDQAHRKHVSAKEFLEEHGVSFPEGADVWFRNDVSGIWVRNTSSNLDLVELIIKQLVVESAKTVVFTTHVLQGPGPLLRRLTAQAANKSDHHAELNELLAAVKSGTVQHLNTARIETKSGTRATAEQVTEHMAISGVEVNDKGEPVFERETRQVGLRVELEPTVGADGVTVELTLAPEYHTAPPLEHREFVIDTQGRRLEFPLTDYFISKTTTGITMPDGTVRLLSLYKPTGRPEFETEDILQAIFITCDILRTGE